jgi:hypothetical protein
MSGAVDACATYCSWERSVEAMRSQGGVNSMGSCEILEEIFVRLYCRLILGAEATPFLFVGSRLTDDRCHLRDLYDVWDVSLLAASVFHGPIDALLGPRVFPLHQLPTPE